MRISSNHKSKTYTQIHKIKSSNYKGREPGERNTRDYKTTTGNN